ncbi:DUF2157 domain-containing protein [bacterium]|nr:DUF2157 domain-containing protein [bacterium]
MKITKKDFEWAVSEDIITHEQAEALWRNLEDRGSSRPRFDMSNILYYFGALIVISAMGWFMTEAWEAFGGAGIFVISMIYALCFLMVGWMLWYRKNLRIPGGLFFTMAVCMTPLMIYGLERLTGIWPQGNPGIYQDFHLWIKGSWLLMEIGTIIAGLIVLKFIRFPFLTAPIFFSLWYMSMDLTPLLFRKTISSWDDRLLVSLWFGLAVIMVSYLMDRRTNDDYAFWGYLFGLMAFWGGLSLMMTKNNETIKLLYCFINLGLVAISVLFQRRAFIVFGSAGIFWYVSHLAYKVFMHSLLFPFALSLLGIFAIYLGIKYQHNQEDIERFMISHIPDGIIQLLPRARI